MLLPAAVLMSASGMVWVVIESTSDFALHVPVSDLGHLGAAVSVGRSKS